MSDDDRTLQIDETTTAWRPRTPDGTILEHPTWADLDADARDAAFEETLVARRIESALDPERRSTTVHAVMNRLH